MDDYHIIPLPDEANLYPRIVVDRHPHGWIAYCPALLASGVFAVGASQYEALATLQYVLERLDIYSGEIKRQVTLSLYH